MTSYEDLRRKVEDSVRAKREIHRLKREIFDLEQTIGYMNEHNLEYDDRFIHARLHISELRNLIENRKQKVWHLENSR